MPPSDLLLATLIAKGRTAPLPSAADWQACAAPGFAELLQYEGCAYWLARKLADQGRLGSVPAAIRSFLDSRSRLSAAHNLRVSAEVARLVRVLADERIPHVLLKGAALLHLTKEVPYGDARLIGDIDVLVPTSAAQPAWSRLQSHGYRPSVGHPPASFDGHHHLAPLFAPGGVGIELHTSTSPRLAGDEAWSRLTADGQVVHVSGAATQVPSLSELAWHAVSHALGEPRYGFRIRAFHDLAVLASSTDSIDWYRVLARAQSPEVPDPTLALRWLATSRHLSAGVPDDLPPGTAPFDLPRALRWRHFVFRTVRVPHRAGHIAVTQADPLSRTRRLLIDEGNGQELLRRLTPSWPCHGRIAIGVRRVASAAARTAYRTWRAADSHRRAS